MFGRKRREDDDIGPSKGLMKWLNKVFRLVLSPFIHPIASLIIMAILGVLVFGVPAYLGVTFDETGAWYRDKIRVGYVAARNWYQTHIGAIGLSDEKSLSDYLPFGPEKGAIVKTETKQNLVDYEVPQTYGRHVFEKAQDVPVDVKGTLEAAQQVETAVAVEDVAQQVETAVAVEKANVVEPQSTSPQEEQIVFKRNPNLDLSYVDVPRRMQGIAYVVNANELRIGETYVLLYGIYAAPRSGSGKLAESYLRQTVAGKTVVCYIGAYTKEGTATAICLRDGVNINQKLVDLAYAKNVSLN